MDGHKENGVFHPHQDKPGIHSSSINHSSDLPPGSVKTGKTLQVDLNVGKQIVIDEMEKESDGDYTGSRFLTPNGIFSVEGDSHNDIIEKYKPLLGMKPYDENEPDMANEFMEKTGMARTMIDPTGKFRYGKGQITIEWKEKATPAQIKVIREIIEDSDLPLEQIAVDEGYANDYKKLYNSLKYYPFGHIN